MEDEPAEAEHEHGEADEGVPVGGEGHGVLIAEDAEHELGEVIGGEGGCEGLQPVRHEADWHPEAAEEGHWQIDEVDDAGCGVGGDELGEQESHAGEADAADYGHAEHLEDFDGGERDAAEGYARGR